MVKILLRPLSLPICLSASPVHPQLFRMVPEQHTRILRGYERNE
jgi:hypothetical protein